MQACVLHAAHAAFMLGCSLGHRRQATLHRCRAAAAAVTGQSDAVNVVGSMSNFSLPAMLLFHAHGFCRRRQQMSICRLLNSIVRQSVIFANVSLVTSFLFCAANIIRYAIYYTLSLMIY